METFLTVIHVLAALFMILVILIQGGNQGGMGAAFGGGNSQGVFGAAGATSFLGKMTYAVAGIFMVTSIALSVVQGNAGKTGLTERLEEAGKAKTEESDAPDSNQLQGPDAGTPAPSSEGSEQDKAQDTPSMSTPEDKSGNSPE